MIRRLLAPSLQCIRVHICLSWVSSCIPNWWERDTINWKKSMNNRLTRSYNSYMKQQKEIPWLQYITHTQLGWTTNSWLHWLIHRNKLDKLSSQDSKKYLNVIYLKLQQPIIDHSNWLRTNKNWCNKKPQKNVKASSTWHQ